MKIVLLPGMDGTGLLFEPLLQALPGDIDAQVLAYPHDKPRSYEQLTDEVRARLPTRQPFVLVAESFSGPIGYAIASAPPTNLTAAVFVATFLSAPNRLLAVLTRLPLSRLFRLPLPLPFIKRFLLGEGADPPTVDLLRKSLSISGSEILAYRMKAMSRLRAGSRRLSLPCSYILAGSDRLVPRRHIDEFRRVAPRIEVVEIPGPHFILQARPRECAQVISQQVRLSSPA